MRQSNYKWQLGVKWLSVRKSVIIPSSLILQLSQCACDRFDKLSFSSKLAHLTLDVLSCIFQGLKDTENIFLVLFSLIFVFFFLV